MYVLDLIVETCGRHRLWGIKYQSSNKRLTTPLRSFCAFIGLCDLVRFFFRARLPGTRFLTFMLNYCWSGLLPVWKRWKILSDVLPLLNRCILSRPLQIVTTTFLFRHLLHCVKKCGSWNRPWRRATRMILISLALLTQLYGRNEILSAVLSSNCILRCFMDSLPSLCLLQWWRGYPDVMAHDARPQSMGISSGNRDYLPLLTTFFLSMAH